MPNNKQTIKPKKNIKTIITTIATEYEDNIDYAITTITIIGIIILILLTVWYIGPYQRELHKKNMKKAVQDKILKEIAFTKKIVYLHNTKNGKKNYDLFKKYNSNPYNYKTKGLIMLYLKKSAYDRYLPAEIIYIKYLMSSIDKYQPDKSKIYSVKWNNYYNLKPKNFSPNYDTVYSQKLNRYGEAIAFTEIIAKQGYKPAIFQLALLYLYGAYPCLYHDNTNEGPGTTIILKFKKPKKAKIMLYNLANVGYKPAIKIVSDIYAQKY